jgi:hypothetical protein
MKVLIINGSPHKNGTTYTALSEVARVLSECGIESEIMQVGHLAIRGCTACLGCRTAGKCVIDDEVNEAAKKFAEADGIVVGSPVWFPLMLAAFIVFLSVYVVIWSVIISFWAVFASVVVSSLAGIFLGIMSIVSGRVYWGIAAIGAGLLCAGLSIFIFFGCAVATKGAAHLTKKIVIGIKNSFVKREDKK